MEEEHFTFKVIGFFHGNTTSKHRAPRQPDATLGIDGTIELMKGQDFEQALQDLETFSHIWLIYGFHSAKDWKPMVLPPRGDKKRGVFATRSPYRPNPIGISVVKLVKISGLKIHVQGTDLLDGTPIYDIKPYIPYADSISDANAGWIDTLNHIETEIILSEEMQLLMNDSESAHIIMHAKQILRDSPYPHPYRRIKQVNENVYEVAIKEWRIQYRILQEGNVILDSMSQAGSIK
jgi:tRNA-Thr(GGU) m(6)t(6)A37 methyltransferase TsaA